MTPEMAWEALKNADAEKDLDDLRDVSQNQSYILPSSSIDESTQAIKTYTKAIPDTTYDQLERSFRHFGFNTYLIAYVSFPSKRIANQLIYISFACRRKK